MAQSTCILWKSKNLSHEDLHLREKFELLKIYNNESHLLRYLLKCLECGQLYFYEFYEEVDWDKGNDPQYSTFIPIKNENDAEEFSKLTTFELLKITPRLIDDLPSDSAKNVTIWIGK